MEWHLRGAFDISSKLSDMFPLAQGVSFFYVLSGFILSYNYCQFSNRMEIKNFLIARIARIYPVHIVTMIIWFLFLGNLNDISVYGKQILSQIMLVHSWIPLREFNSSLNAVSWSISCEWMFYLLFPVLIMKFKKYGCNIIFISFLIVILFCFSSNILNISTVDAEMEIVNTFSYIYTNPLVRIFEFIVGIGAYFVYNHLKQYVVELSDINFTCVEVFLIILSFIIMACGGLLYEYERTTEVFGNGFANWLRYSSNVATFFMIVIVFAFSRGLISKILSWSVFEFLGKASFCLYMIHFTPSYLLKLHYTEMQLLFPHGLHIIFVIAMLLYACFMYKFVETPMRNIIRKRFININSEFYQSN